MIVLPRFNMVIFILTIISDMHHGASTDCTDGILPSGILPQVSAIFRYTTLSRSESIDLNQALV